MTASDKQTLVAQVLAAYLGHNVVAPEDLASVIKTVQRNLNAPQSVDETASRRAPVVPVDQSVSPFAITCLVCGEKFKTMKRHVRTVHDMTLAQYRAEFDLEDTYPLVAPNYAATRAQTAKKYNLGRRKARLAKQGSPELNSAERESADLL